MKRSKMFWAGVMATVAISCGALGAVALLPVYTNYASAQANAMTVDALGNLTWEEVDGATSYNWTYQYGNGTPMEANTQTPSVNVNGVFKAAVEAGSSKVTFTVTSDNGTSVEYVHTITGYTGYTGETQDISEFMTADKTTVQTRAQNISDIQYSKNTMFTWGMNIDAPYCQNERITVKLGGVPRMTDKLYNGAVDNTARYFMSVLDNQWVVKTKAINHTKDYTTGDVLLNLSTNYYFELAVMDNYSASGEEVGEKVYLAMYMYQNGAKTLVNSETWEFATASITADDVAQWTEDDKISLDVCLYKQGGVYYIDKLGNVYTSSGTGLSKVQLDTKTYLFSGDPTAALGIEAEFAVNAYGTLSWKEMEGVTGYKVSYPLASGTKTITVDTSEINVNEALAYAAQQANGLNTDTDTENDVEFAVVPFTVTLLSESGNDVALSFEYPFTQYFDYDGSYDVSDKWNGKTRQALAGTSVEYHKNHLLTFGLESDIDTAGYSIKFGDTGRTDAHNGAVNIFADGSTKWRVKLRTGSYSYRQASAIAANDKGYFKLGVFDTYDYMGNLIGDTFYVSHESYDYTNEELKAKDEMTWLYKTEAINAQKENGTYIGWAGIDDGVELTTATFAMVSGYVSPNTYISSYNTKPTLSEKEFVAEVMSGDDFLQRLEGLKYGKPYDLSVQAVEAEKAGYSLVGWKMQYNGETLCLPQSGLWWYNFETGRTLLEATYSLIDYNVTYNAACDNPVTYNIESDFALNAPTTIPNGKVFDGWYLKEDTEFSTPITSLKGKTGDLELVARFINGYTIVVEGQAYDWKEGDGAFVLTAPAVLGKTFSKWQVVSGGDYVDYTGETSFEPTGDMTFKAVYDWNTYTITYVAEGATHNNVASYTGENVVTFNRASKEGYFFLGWYKDDTFETLVTDTDGFAEELTLYAKFAEDKISTQSTFSVSETAQSLPVPQLPEGAQYFVELYSGEILLSLTDNTYVFDKMGVYTVNYTISLPTGETVVRKMVLTVEQFYTVNVYYGDGEMLSLQIKSGEKLSETDIPQPPEGVSFGGLYTDYKFTNVFDLNTTITQDMNIYAKWNVKGDDGNINSDSSSGCSSGIVGKGILISVGVVALLLLKKKKRNDEICG